MQIPPNSKRLTARGYIFHDSVLYFKGSKALSHTPPSLLDPDGQTKLVWNLNSVALNSKKSSCLSIGAKNTGVRHHTYLLYVSQAGLLTSCVPKDDFELLILCRHLPSARIISVHYCVWVYMIDVCICVFVYVCVCMEARVNARHFHYHLLSC